MPFDYLTAYYYPSRTAIGTTSFRGNTWNVYSNWPVYGNFELDKPFQIEEKLKKEIKENFPLVKWNFSNAIKEPVFWDYTILITGIYKNRFRISYGYKNNFKIFDGDSHLIIEFSRPEYKKRDINSYLEILNKPVI
jgi:hypothetical protein